MDELADGNVSRTAHGTASKPAVVARDVWKHYGEFAAVRGISFEIPRGVVFGFLGPNGAGKSSTMRMLHGLSPVSRGTLTVFGEDVTLTARAVKRRIGVVPQEANLDSDMTPFENLVTHARFFDVTGRAAREKADELLDAVQLTEKRDVRVSELSGGMKRRLLIARALVNDPELLVLDEPTTGLDPQSRSLLWERIRDMRRAGRTVILTTHYMDEAERLSDELLLIDKGQIIAQGEPRALVRDVVGTDVVEVSLADGATVDALLRVAGRDAVGHVDRVGDDVILHSADAEGVLERIVESDVRTRRAGVRRATLEDAFLKLTGRALTD